MALSQTGANYANQSELQRRDHVLGAALDDLASQIESVRQQTNTGQSGVPAAPHPVTTIAVKAAGGFASISLTHNNAPAGSQYLIEMSTTSNFQTGTTSQIDNGISLTHPPLYLKGQTLYFRAAAKFAASAASAWTYFGGQAAPTAVTF